MGKVLITGGSGMVGQRLTALLLERGQEVVHLGRKAGTLPNGVKAYKWDYTQDYLDKTALVGVNTIIHLAGAGVADARWTAARKKEILDSRVKTAGLLYQALSDDKQQVKAMISASAVGWYGDGEGSWQVEEDPAGKGFLGETCVAWEQAISRFNKLNIRECRMRIGIVLSDKGGALPKMDKPIRLGIGAYLGNGRQYMPWIHIDDVCRLFIKAIDDETMAGAYNTVAPEPVTARDFSATIAKVLGRPFIPAPGPAFALRLIMGEMADMLLFSNRASATKILKQGYVFRFNHLEDALRDIYGK